MGNIEKKMVHSYGFSHYSRRCIRCDNIYKTTGKYSRICPECDKNLKRKKKAITKFKIMFDSIPPVVAKQLVYHYWDNPMSLNVCWFEIKHNTKIGKKILKDFGFKDD